MTITNGYATLPDLRAWMGNQLPSSQEAEAERVIGAVSRLIDATCDRVFYSTASSARVFDVVNPMQLSLGDFNDLASLVSLKSDEDDDGTFERTWTSAEYTLQPRQRATGPEARPIRAIRVRGTTTTPFPLGGTVEVTGVWGWAAVPEAVTQACLMQTHRLFSRKNSPGGLVVGDFGGIRVPSKLDPEVELLLDGYMLKSGQFA